MRGRVPLALVTGGAGLIGSHVVDLLLREGWRVRVLDSLTRPAHADGLPGWVPPEVDFWCGDVRQADTLREALAGVDYVFHQAAHGGFTPGAAAYFETNTVVAARMLDILGQGNRRSVRKIVFASTQAVYGEGKYLCPEHGHIYPSPRSLVRLRRGLWEPICPRCGTALEAQPVDEERIDPHTPYAISKAAAETIFVRMGQTCGLPVTGLRYGLTYGPRQSLTNPFTGITSIFTTRLLAGEPILIFEDGRQMRDFIYVEDVARANLFVALDDHTDGLILNVGTGRGTTIADFCRLLARTLGVPNRVELTNEYRPGEVRHLITDAGRLREMGWEPETDLEEGLRRYVAWVRSQPATKDCLGPELPRLRKTGVVRKVTERPAG